MLTIPAWEAPCPVPQFVISCLGLRGNSNLRVNYNEKTTAESRVCPHFSEEPDHSERLIVVNGYIYFVWLSDSSIFIYRTNKK